MFEDKTFAAILEDGKKQISNNVIKNEGSLVHNALAVIAYELEKLYIQADYIMKQLNPAEADYENLVILAAARSVYPDEATHVQARMIADAEVPLGARFSLSAYNYVVLSKEPGTFYNYVVQCEEAGSGANGLLGVLTPITYVEGLTKAELTEMLVAGRNASDREELYNKYLNSFRENAFGGNVAEYKEHLMAFEGIGGAKVYPVWDGPGTVKGVLMGSDYGTVSSYLISEIQQKMSPRPAEGYGIAPIGHTVTIVSVEGVVINLQTDITFKNGYSWENLQSEITSVVSEYLLALRKEWPLGGVDDCCTVYISRIESAILDVEGILDVAGTTINGESGNLVLNYDQIPVMGGVSGL